MLVIDHVVAWEDGTWDKLQLSSKVILKTWMHLITTTSDIAKWGSQHVNFITWCLMKQFKMNKKKKSKRQEAETRWESFNTSPHKLKSKRTKIILLRIARSYLEKWEHKRLPDDGSGAILCSWHEFLGHEKEP